ncbi:pentapeptide repeat-containing protein [Picosynechococcus sp. NKBG042902]|uniref:pentapeptide repeat-containing protein n=1 Tax=Picosynechococcus sp. NKBG042902 TaxID=490193 RepID=UPI0004AB7E51|nr:pentapeptide repeat-containing protein [Picosynechococcus sp. NKBG042902]
MKKLLFTACCVLPLAIAPQVRAENLTHVSQLLSSRQCQNCQLTRSGLANARLDGADLRGADLRQANLSRADLSLADLRGANLTGASLVGANLAGADLEGANLDGADLREAYLAGANFTNTSLRTFYIARAVGLLDAPVSAEQLYQWGFVEGENKNYRMAIAYYDAAANQEPDNGAIYLSRAIARYQLRDFAQAQQDATFAQTLFTSQGSTVGVDASQRLLDEIDLALNPKQDSGNTAGNILSAISSVLLRFFF